ncbi:MAG: CBS domain-containing protein [Chitinophagales bacterium]
MIAPHLISDSIPALHTDDPGEQALIQMHEYNVGQLPVIEGKKYVGIVTMEELISSKHLSHPLKDIVQNFRKPFVRNTAHIFDIMKAAVEFNVRIVPVVDDQQNYLGLVSAESCLRAFAVLNSVNEPGAIIELEIARKDYSLSQLSHIVEDSEAAIICFYSHMNNDSGNVEITIKVNTNEVAGIIASFERYNYEVKSVHNDVEYGEDLKDRYDALMRYLNI